MKLGKGEKTGNPIFLNLKAKNFHVRQKSPALDAGIDLGYRQDFEGDQVPQGKAPEMGAFESRMESRTPQP